MNRIKKLGKSLTKPLKYCYRKIKKALKIIKEKVLCFIDNYLRFFFIGLCCAGLSILSVLLMGSFIKFVAISLVMVNPLNLLWIIPVGCLIGFFTFNSFMGGIAGIGLSISSMLE